MRVSVFSLVWDAAWLGWTVAMTIYALTTAVRGSTVSWFFVALFVLLDLFWVFVVRRNTRNARLFGIIGYDKKVSTFGNVR